MGTEPRRMRSWRKWNALIEITPRATGAQTYSKWTTSVQLSTSSVTLNKSGMCPFTSTLGSEGGLYPHCIYGDYKLRHTHTHTHTHTPNTHTHTHINIHTDSERSNYLLENAGTMEAPDGHQEPTQGSLATAPCPQRNKGDFVSLFKSSGFGCISVPPPYGPFKNRFILHYLGTGPTSGPGRAQSCTVSRSCGKRGHDD